MIIQNEDEILDPKIRAKIIQDIQSQPNIRRKAEMFKRYECYKDKTFLYVIRMLLAQFDQSTVDEMQYCLSNLGISRKVIDKLARVYKYGVERDLYVDGKEQDDDIILKEVAKILKVDQTMKKTNRFFKLFKNTSLYIRPCPVSEEVDAPFVIKLTPLAPYLYDVVEMKDEREKAMVYILSDYNPNLVGQTPAPQGLPILAAAPGTDGRNGNVIPAYFSGDGVQKTIAEPNQTPDKKKYTFWSNKYHFVCNGRGEIIPEDTDGQDNPIETLPFVNYAEDQDGSFWAQGGDDLTSGSILINAMITNILHIGVTQGYGQMILTGKDLPKSIKVGPNKAIRLTHEGEDPVPTFKFESANPPLDQLRALVEMYVALLLTTNNLSTSGVQSNLSGGVSFPSGIAMLIDKSESMEDVEDQRQVFEDNEPIVWDKIAKWHKHLKAKKELPEDLAKLEFPEKFEVKTTFADPKPIETEKERLEVIKLKLEIGLTSMLDAIKLENPQLDDDQAKAKLAEILEEKMIKAAQALGAQNGSNGQQGNEQSNDGSDQAGGQSPGRSEDGSGRVPSGAGASEGSSEAKPGNG